MVLLSMLAPSMAEAVEATAADASKTLWGASIGASGRCWAVEDEGGPPWLLVWCDVAAARTVKAAASGSWAGRGWRRARLASLDASDRATLPDEDRERLDAALE